MTPAAEVVSERARRFGPLPFHEVVEVALYHPEHGFYGTGGGAGRAGDFLTSPEVGPLFGAVMARAIDTWWDDLGRPDPFVVIEAGAGAGTLAASILAAEPSCAPALRYVLVERSPVARAAQTKRLALEPAGQVLATAIGGAHQDDDAGDGREGTGTGPLVTSLEELPAGPFTGVVMANELLDNLPFDLLQRSRQLATTRPAPAAMPGGDPEWSEVRIDADLHEVLVPALPQDADDARQLAPDAPLGGRIPLQRQARAWLRAALACLGKGRIVVIDYADSTPSLAARPWTDWVRTYRGHGRGSGPLDDLGLQDITTEVAADQLARVRVPARASTQAQFLARQGIDRLVAEARAGWEAGAARGDLAALKERSRLTEAAALTDVSGLGAFGVLEWVVR